MTSVNFSEKFCGNNEIEQIIRMVELGNLPKYHLINDFNSIYQAPKPTIVNTINILCESGVLLCKDENISLISKAYKELLRSYILRKSIFSTIYIAFRLVDNHIILDTFLLPDKFTSVVFLLALVGVASRPAGSGYRYWPIEAEFIEVIFSLISECNAAFINSSNSLSLAGLNRINEKKSEYGREAEIWYLNYERKRLINHPFADQVKIISDDNVSAGYDIVSFIDKTSLIYDKYVEVKSFAEFPRIFMSANELETAKNLENSYVLVLVNRLKISEPGYVPREIINPYDYFFGVHRSEWISITTASYEIEFDF